MKWTNEGSEVVAETPYVKITKDLISNDNGGPFDYWVMHRPDAVMIIPVRVDLSEPTYVFVNQNRYPAQLLSLEFPAGMREPGESLHDAAVRELKQETGLLAEHLKLLYVSFANPGRSTSKLSVYLAVVTGAPNSDNIEEFERAAELVTVQLTTSQLHQKVLDNTIVDQSTLAALAVMIMQNPKASEYLGVSPGAPNKENNA